MSTVLLNTICVWNVTLRDRTQAFNRTFLAVFAKCYYIKYRTPGPKGLSPKIS